MDPKAVDPKSGLNGAPFNDEMRVKLELQRAILQVTQEFLKENRAKILERAQARLKVLTAQRETT
jgi:hypothetical protein